jgi:WD40 repeat protein
MMIKKIAQLMGHQGSVFALTQGRTPQFVLSGAGDGWIVEWDLEHPEVGKLLAKVDSNIFSLLFLPDKNQIIAGNMNGGLHFIDLNNPDQNKNITHHHKGVFDIQLIHNQLFTLGGDGIITRWSVEESRSIESFQLSAKSLRCLDFSNERREFAIGASDGHIYFLDENLNLKNIIKNAHKNSVFSTKYALGGQYLLSGGRDALIKIWDLDKNITPNHDWKESLFELSAHLYTINKIAFHPKNPEVFATASRDKTIKIWQLITSKENNNFKIEEVKLLKVINTIRYGGHLNSVNTLYWTPHNNWLISGSDDRSLMIWDINLEI